MENEGSSKSSERFLKMKRKHDVLLLMFINSE